MADDATNNVHDVEFISPSGNDIVDGIQLGFRYAAETDGNFTVTYSIPKTGALFNDEYLIDGVEVSKGFFQVTAEVENWFRDAVNFADSVSNLSLTEVTEQGETFGEIRLAATTDLSPPLGAQTFGNINVFDKNQTGDIFIDDRAFTDDFQGLHRVVIHELGHALGLGHPGDGFGGAIQLPDTYNGDEYTLMDTNFASVLFDNATWSDLQPTTFMYVDILAIQGLYGASQTTNNGDDSYNFDLSGRHYQTIYDLGGTDTIMITGTSGSKTGDSISIDLKGGADALGGRFVDVGTLVTYTDANGTTVGTNSNTVYISPETVIEKVTAAAGDDFIAGNSANNEFIGGNGNDTMNGGEGNDTLSGGNGDDALWAGAGDNGNDISMGGAGDDTIGGGAGNDSLSGGSGSDLLFGGSGNDLLAANTTDTASNNADTATNTAWAGDGDDTILGANGDDRIGGGLGHDSISGAGGNDTIYAGKSGNDTLSGGDGNDLIFSGIDNDNVSGGSGNDELYGGKGNDTVTGDAGDDTLYGGADADTLTGGHGDDYLHGGDGADMFVFAAGDGDDTLDAFNITDDTLDLSGTSTDFTDTASVSNAATTTTIGNVSGLLIDTGSGDSLFLTGLEVSDLTTMSFVF